MGYHVGAQHIARVIGPVEEEVKRALWVLAHQAAQRLESVAAQAFQLVAGQQKARRNGKVHGKREGIGRLRELTERRMSENYQRAKDYYRPDAGNQWGMRKRLIWPLGFEQARAAGHVEFEPPIKPMSHASRAAFTAKQPCLSAGYLAASERAFLLFTGPAKQGQVNTEKNNETRTDNWIHRIC